MESLYEQLNVLLILSSIMGGIMLVVWLVFLSGIKRCIVIFFNQEILKKMAGAQNAQVFNAILIENGINPKNQLAKMVCTICVLGKNKEHLDLDALLMKLKNHFDSKKDYVTRLAWLIFILSSLISLSMEDIGFRWLFASVIVLIIINIISKFVADDVYDIACSQAIEVYKPYFYQVDKVRFDIKIGMIKNVLAAIEEEKKSILISTDQTISSQNSAKQSLENLEQIRTVLKDLYDFEVNNSQLSPKAAVDMLNESIKSIDGTIKDVHSVNQENINFFKGIFSRISNIGEIEQSIKNLSTQAIESMREFTNRHTGIAVSIDTQLSEKLGELVNDSKSSFMSLNEMSNKIYAQMEEIFAKYVETSNTLCQTTELHYNQLNGNINAFCKNVNVKLANIYNANEQIETGVIALCSANYNLIDMLTKNSIVNPNVKMPVKEQGKDDKSIRAYFESMSIDLKKARENLEKLAVNAPKGGEYK